MTKEEEATESLIAKHTWEMAGIMQAAFAIKENNPFGGFEAKGRFAQQSFARAEDLIRRVVADAFKAARAEAIMKSLAAPPVNHNQPLRKESTK